MIRSAAFLPFVVAVLSLNAQVASRIAGAIVDNSDAPAPGAGGTLTQTRTGVTLASTTNESGALLFSQSAGRRVRRRGGEAGIQKAVSEQLRLDVNQVIDLNLRLEVGELSQQVEVSATAALLQTSDSQVGTVVENQQIRTMPPAARDFMQLSLAPRCSRIAR